MRRTLLLLSLLAAPASAQIRMPKPRLPNPLDRARQATTPANTPTYDDRVLEITDARLTGLLRGLDAERRQRPALEASYKQNADARAAYDVARRGAEGREEQIAACTRNSPEYRQAMGDTTAAGQMALSTRIQVLQARGDYNAIKVIGDSVMRVTMMRDSLITTARNRCEGHADAPTGPPPAEPSRSLGDSIQVIGAAASGMSPQAYAVMRERVLAYLTTDEAALRNSMYAFGGNEMTALRAKRAQLQRYQDTLAAE